MSERHQRVINDYRKRLSTHERQAEQQLEHAYAHVLKTIQPTLDHLYNQMVEKMANGEKIPIHFLYEAQRLESIKHLIQGSIDHFAALSQAQTAQIQHFAAQLGQESAQELLQATVPKGISWTFGRPSPQAIANIVGATQAGSPLSDLFQGFGREAADGAAKALIRGVTLGNNPRQIASEIAQALQVPRWRALTIARSSMLDTYRSANFETFKANDDVVGGWIWQAALGRACAACTAMNGTEHTLEETLDAHPNCACVPLPKTRSWADILSPLGVDVSNIPDTTISVLSGSEWFDNQDAATQLSVLGSKAAYDLYKSGDADLSDFIGWNESEEWGRSLYQKSVKQLTKAG